MNDRLGRGLSALIPDGDKDPQIHTGIGTLPICRISPNRYQPRKKFDPERLQELAQSILENGIIQPLIVTKSEGSDYELIAGERRLEAARLAGLDSVPVVIRSVSKKEQLQMAVIENIQREDLDPIEEALAYQTLAEEFRLTHAEIAVVMGKNRSSISNSLRLLNLPEEVIRLVAEDAISAGHGRAILMAQPEYQLDFAHFIIKYQLNVRQAEARAPNFTGSTQAGAKAPKNPLTRSFEQELSSIFGLKASVREAGGKGKITLEYRNPAELERLKQILNNLR